MSTIHFSLVNIPLKSQEVCLHSSLICYLVFVILSTYEQSIFLNSFPSKCTLNIFYFMISTVFTTVRNNYCIIGIELLFHFFFSQLTYSKAYETQTTNNKYLRNFVTAMFYKLQESVCNTIHHDVLCQTTNSTLKKNPTAEPGIEP